MKKWRWLISLFAFGELAFAETTKAEHEEEGEGAPAFSHSFICLKEAQRPDRKKVEKAFRNAFSMDENASLEVEIEEEKDEDGKPDGFGITVSFDEKNFLVARTMGFAVPWPDIEYACMNSFYWPEGEKILKPSKDHMVVFAMNQNEKASERALFLSRALSALAIATDALGIYYGNADIVQEPKAYAELIPTKIAKAEDVPAFAWVGFLRAGHEDGTSSLYTRGLSEFGCKEIEVVESESDFFEILELVFGLSQYLIFEGDVIDDGDTVGGTETEKIKVRFEKSELDREGKVLRVDF